MAQKLPALLAAASALALAGTATGEEPAAPAVQAEAQADAETVLSMEDLEALSGGTGVRIDVITGQDLDALNRGNVVYGGEQVGSGAITLSQGGLSGFDGVGNFVMNTGHNNNLQSSLNVSIVLAP